MKKLFRSPSKQGASKSVGIRDDDDDNYAPDDERGLHRPPSLQLAPRCSAMKVPQISPSTPSPEQESLNLTTTRSKSVRFQASEVTYMEAQQYTHQQRFTINSGLYLHFEKPPTTHYKFLTTAESIHTRGTLRQLITSASAEDNGNAWDSVTPLPQFAARYVNPRYTRETKSIYWEMQIQSLGFSRFSSLDGTVTPATPATPVPGEEGDTLGDLGLNRSLSLKLNNVVKAGPGRRTGSKLAMGFICKCVTPDTVPFLRRKSSLRPNDEFTFPYCISGSGVFWCSEDGGSVYVDGKRTRHSIAAGAGDVVGMGMTFGTVPSGEEECDRPEASFVDVKGRKISTSVLNTPGMEPEELKTVPTTVWLVVNGQRYVIATSEPSTNPFDVVLPDYLCGIYDVFPVICVQGAGVEVKTKMGEAVDWTGPGGKEDAKLQTIGDRKGSALGSVNGAPPSADGAGVGERERKDSKDAGKNKVGKWWHRASIST